ncbi:MAG: hypothetical protein LUE27_06865 [Clostridia bacterium]|nr:hypothetical protein [Clostridia bacterium]
MGKWKEWRERRRKKSAESKEPYKPKAHAMQDVSMGELVECFKAHIKAELALWEDIQRSVIGDTYCNGQPIKGYMKSLYQLLTDLECISDKVICKAGDCEYGMILWEHDASAGYYPYRTEFYLINNIVNESEDSSKKELK